ncbi:chloramphenicol phosphotransferase CPT [Streptomyces sp. NPDC050504]|uniref:chloramphenicol phosphotransferase CPT n=1 Tax=Streptomyces sp. NPDC050504 TaxID=3365618 RepID=UPI003789827F
MPTRLIVLNGGSSSGKSRIVRCLQEVLPGGPWLAFGIDALIEALPVAFQEPGSDGIEFAADGGVNVGGGFREAEAAWMAGLAATARAGARIVVDDVFLGAVESQRRWEKALAGLDVLWVGVRCEAAVAEAREAARGDRVPGMARSQAESVHEGVHYDLEVDTSGAGSLECARLIADRVLHAP